MNLLRSEGAKAKEGDFGAKVVAAGVEAPPEIVELAVKHALPTAEALLGFARTFPSTVACELGWSGEAAQAAAARLAGQMAEAGYAEPKLVKRAYGFNGGA